MTPESLAPPVNYAPPPEAFPPAPRKVRMRWPKQWSSLIPLAFIAGFMLVGVATFFLWLGPKLLMYAAIDIGTTAPAEITDKVKLGTRGAKYKIFFTFHADGVAQSAQVYVHLDTYEEYKVGDPITVRYLNLAPHWSMSIDGPHTSRSWFDLCHALCILAWNAAIYGIAGFLFLAWRVSRNLVRFGTPTLGRVTNKQIAHSKLGNYLVTYTFRALDGADREARMHVDQRAYEALAIGQEITVLYNPDNPLSNVIYRCGEFDVLTSDDKAL